MKAAVLEEINQPLVIGVTYDAWNNIVKETAAEENGVLILKICDVKLVVAA